MIRVLLVADTHLGRAQGGRLTQRLEDALAHADRIIHAGDITDASVLDELARFAPVHAVRGNNDVTPALLDLLPERIVVDVGGCTFAVVHETGPAAGRTARLRRSFPAADVVVFGHSHIPWHETDVDGSGHVQHHVNPGSAMQRRRQPHCSVAWVDVEDGSIVGVRHVMV